MNKLSDLTEKEFTLLEALPGAAALVDEGGAIVKSNETWQTKKRGPQWFGIQSKTDNYFDHCHHAVEQGNDFALQLIFGLRNVLDGRKKLFEQTIPFHSDDSQQWYRVSITAFGANTGSALIIFEDITKNTKTIHSLRDAEERYSQQFMHSVSGIIIGSPDGRVLDANPAACRILGYTREELIAGGRSMIVDENHALHKEGHRVRSEQPYYEGEKVYIHKSGREIPIEITSVLYRTENGELRSINTFRDKTTEKETEKKLEAEKRFTNLSINSVPGVFFVTNKDGEFIRWNNAFIEDLGYSEEEIKGLNARELVHKSDLDRTVEIFMDVFESGTGHAITQIETREGRIRTYHFFANRFENNGELFLVGTGTDITDMIELEKERDKNYEMMSQLFKNSPMPMLMINSQNSVIKTNESFISLFGYPAEEIIGENMFKKIIPEIEYKDMAEAVEEAFQGRKMIKKGIRYTKNGDPRTVLISTVPLVNIDEVVAVYIVYVDLTEQVNLQTELEKSLNQKEILLQEVHHRVKNNLAVIAGLIDLQILEKPAPAVEKELIEVRSRIFSIAKIHETLYQEVDVVSIRFDRYLETMIHALPQRDSYTGNELKIDLNIEPLTLNLNQAVPFGLTLNELLNVIFLNADSSVNLNISLSSDEEDITLKIVADTQTQLPLIDSENFQGKLIEIFLAQLEGTMVQNDQEKHVMNIHFKKADIRGSSSSLKTMSELFY